LIVSYLQTRKPKISSRFSCESFKDLLEKWQLNAILKKKNK
jgi:hypothetical protein